MEVKEKYLKEIVVCLCWKKVSCVYLVFVLCDELVLIK